MKRVVCMLALILAGCSTMKTADPCGGHNGYTRGLSDAESGRPYAPACGNERSYKEGYDAVVKGPAQRRSEAMSRRIQSIPAWVCEVESSSKVFTGVGSSEKEAAVSAQKSCGTHFQAKECTNTECRSTL